MSAAPTRQPLNCNFVALPLLSPSKWRKSGIFLCDGQPPKATKPPESLDLSTESARDVGPHGLRFALNHVDPGLHQVSNRDESHHPAIVDHRKMPDSAPRHQ